MQATKTLRQVGIRQRSVTPRFGRATVLAFVLATGAIAVLPDAATAQDLSWDATSGNTAVDGGIGSWDGITANWTGDVGVTNQEWVAGNNATFGGTAGTVTVVGTQETNYITVQTDGYTLQGGALTFSATGSSGVTVETGTTTIATDLTSTNGFNKAGEGTLILSGTNSLAGTLNVLRGDLVATNADALAGISNLYIQAPDLSPVTADLGGGTVSISNFIVQGYGATGISNGTVSFTGLGQIGNAIVDTTLTGTGNLSATGGGQATLNAVNTYSGTTSTGSANVVVVSATGSISNSAVITNNGTLNVNGAGGNAISDTATINNSGNFILTGSDETVGSVFGAGKINLNANTLTTGDATNVEISGVISGAGDLVKQGAGTFTLSGVSTGTGTLVNNAGTVDLTGTWAGDVNNTGAGTFTTTGTVSGAVTTAGIMNANSGANLNGLVTVTTGTLNANGALFNAGLTVESGGTLDLDADTDVTGTVNLSGAVTNTGGGNKVLAGGQIDAGGTIAAGAGNTVTLEAGLIVVSNGYSILNGGVIYDGDLRNAITTGPFAMNGAMLGNVYTAAGATTQFTANTNFSGFDLDVEAATANVDIDAGVAVSNVGQFINTGTTDIGASGSLTAVSVSNEGGAIINLGTDATLTGTGNTTDNAGTVNVAGGGALVEVTGDYNNLTTGIVNFNDAASKVFDVQAGVITNDGTLNFNAGATTVNSVGGSIQNTGTGDINIANNATLNAAGDTIANAGSIDILGTGSILTFTTLNNNTGGEVNAQGTLTGNVVNQGSGDFNVVGNMISTGLNITNTDAATLDVGTGTLSVIGDLTNTTTSGTGVTVAAGAGFNAVFIGNGLSGGSAASLITNNGGLYSDTSITNHAGATLNSNTANSLIAYEFTLTNNGTVNMQGRIGGGTVVNSGADATFNVTGDLNLNNSNPLNAFTNQNAAVLNVTGGTFWLDALTNTSGGTGTSLATAGVQIAADSGLVVAGAVANSGVGTINNAGSIQAATITNGDGTNAATLTNTGTLTSLATTGTGVSNAAGSTLVSTGTIDADASAFMNAGVADVAGTLFANATNTGDFEATGNLAHTGTFINNGTGTVTVTAGVMDTSGSFTNNSSVAGTTLGTAGVSIAAGTELEAQNVVNATGASIVVAGTLDTIAMANDAISNLGTLTFEATGVALGTISNAGTLTSTGQLNEGLINTGTATISNQVLGAVFNNAGGLLNIDGDLVMNNTLWNAPGAIVTLNGTLSGLAILANAGDLRLEAGASIITTGNFSNTGFTELRNGSAGETLMIGGDYSGGGSIGLDVVLGGDASTTDRLVVNGATSGSTEVFVSNLGGAGASNSAGILVVDVGGTSGGDFVLANGDTALPGGKMGISVGSAYVYALRDVGGDWYMRSQLQPATVVYQALPAALMGQMQAQGLMQRLAGRQMLGRATEGTGAGNSEVTVSSRGMAQDSILDGAWLSVSGTEFDVTPDFSSTGLSYEQSTWRMQAGLDMVLHEGSGGVWIGGASLFAGGSDLDATSALGGGSVASDARGVGLTATWYGDTGFYADLQLEYSRFDSDVASDSTGALADGLEGIGRFASVEMGQDFALENGLTLTPQAQLSWAEVEIDSFDAGGATVSAGDSESVQLRLGLAAEHAWSTDTATDARLYGIANVTREFRGDTDVLIDKTAIAASALDWTAELGVGGSYDWQDGGRQTSIYGEISATRAVSGGDMTGLSGTVGLRVTW